MKLFNSLLRLALLSATILVVSSCSEEDSPDALTIVSIVAEGNDVLTGNAVSVNLNAAAAATGVPVNPTIIITFSKSLDATTVSSSAISIDVDGTAVTTNVSVNDAVVTITLSEELSRGTDYNISLTDGLIASDKGIFVATSRIFTTGGVAPVTPPHEADQVAYWNFDNNADDATGNYSTVNITEIEYISDRHGQAESTASFDGDASIIEIADGDQLMDTDDFTLSFWIKSNSSDKNDNDETRGQFVLGLAGWNGFQFEIFGNYGGLKLAAQYELDDGATAAQDLWWSTNGNLGWQGWTYDHDVSASGGLSAIIADKWAHVLVTYDATTKVGAIYINGVLRKSQDYNLYGENHALYRTVGMGYAGNESPGNRLALGFIQGSENRIITDDWANPVGFPDNNHFKGEMDDLRIFHAAFTAADVTQLYEDEQP